MKKSSKNKYDKKFLELAHQSSSMHKNEIMQSELCGCFCCEQTFKPTEIEEWVNDNTTAICPKCGVDSVLSAKFPVNDSCFLSEMNHFWF